MKIAVGSKNPAKLQAVEMAFKAIWPETQWEVLGIDVDSGVGSQPMSDLESIKGARARATKARAELDADYGVGLEGGLQKTGDAYYDCGWMVVVDRAGTEGVGSSIKMPVPHKLLELIMQGDELGVALDKTFGTKNIKHSAGHFGLMTNNVITRIHGYRDGVIAALSRFIKPEVFLVDGHLEE